MSRKWIFEPIISTFLKTDEKNHGNTVEFKISYGIELENPNPIFIQMLEDGKIKGRQAPSFSDNDFEKIIEIRKVLKSEFEVLDIRVRDARISIPNLTSEKSQF